MNKKYNLLYITARHAGEKVFNQKKRNATVLSSTNNKVGFFFLVVRHLDTAAAGAGQVAGGQWWHSTPATSHLALALAELSN